MSGPACGHFRHWNKTCADGSAPCPDGDGHHAYETCDECGRTVCFDIDCGNGYAWDGGALLCCPCLDKSEAAPPSKPLDGIGMGVIARSTGIGG